MCGAAGMAGTSQWLMSPPCTGFWPNPLHTHRSQCQALIPMSRSQWRGDRDSLQLAWGREVSPPHASLQRQPQTQLWPVWAAVWQVDRSGLASSSFSQLVGRNLKVAFGAAVSQNGFQNIYFHWVNVGQEFCRTHNSINYVQKYNFVYDWKWMKNCLKFLSSSRAALWHNEHGCDGCCLLWIHFVSLLVNWLKSWWLNQMNVKIITIRSAYFSFSIIFTGENPLTKYFLVSSSQAVFSSVFYFASVPLYQGFLTIGWGTNSARRWLAKRAFGCLASLAFPLTWSAVEMREQGKCETVDGVAFHCWVGQWNVWIVIVCVRVCPSAATPLSTRCSPSSRWSWTKTSSQKLQCCTQSCTRISSRYLTRMVAFERGRE